MAEQFYTLLTKVGKAKIANASALGTKLNLAKFQVGDSNGSYYNPTEEQTDLKNKVWEGVISSITVDENNPNWIVLQTILPGNIGGFMIREAGVFDSEGNLIAIGKYPETYKPQSADGSTKDLVIKMILEVSNASSVTLKVDPTVILATKKDIEILENKIKDIKIPVASVNNKTGAVELSASDVGAYSKTEVDNKFKGITVPVTKVNGKTGDVDLKASDIKTSSGKTIETSLEEKMNKKIVDDSTTKKYELGIKNGLLYYREVL
ncbi:phage tail protein [Hathewaya massiliensis]|uniref:phage tail protein n=1 Tax=Hathewaya massiliensis TaxID=1964382 RepID=UPI00115BE94E|nr:phage tail protein [Hathewaya massiliensis]